MSKEQVFYISYAWSHEGVYGVGSIDVKMQGLFSHNDMKALCDKIKPVLKKDYPNLTGDFGVVILNWRKYDELQGEELYPKEIDDAGQGMGEGVIPVSIEFGKELVPF